jgi:AcrR family transcriptional regulator
LDGELISKKSRQLRLYFAKTARDMILESGMESVSIRNVAKRAGYAYATIYNHFGSLDELLWLTRNLFMADVEAYIEKHTMNLVIDSKDSVCALFSAYADYFIKHPSVYRFLYFHTLNKDARTTQSYVETNGFKEKFNRTFAFLSAGKDAREVEYVIKIIQYSIHGLLTTCIADNDGIGIEAVHGELERIIRFLLD